MYDYELEHTYFNNPALIVPAAQGVQPNRQRPKSNTKTQPVRSEDSRTLMASAQSPTKYDVSTGLTIEVDKANRMQVGWGRIVRNFSPSWFSVTMGTGIVSLLFAATLFETHWLYWFAAIFLGLNAVLFACAFFISALRFTLYPEIWAVMIVDSTNSLFLGKIPM